MERRAIGTLEVSTVGLGCNNFGWRIDEAASRAVVAAALDGGITFFDTAELYGGGSSEEFLGRALGVRRRDVVVATKFGHRSGHPARGGHPHNVRRAAHESLRRLRTDYIDLFQLHTPDPDVPIAETLGALGDLVVDGTVREVGCSNFSRAQLADADAAVTPHATRFASVQNEFSLLARAEAPLVDACAREARAFLPYYPLASGMLTGKYRSGAPAPAGTRITDGGRYAPLLDERNLGLVEEFATFAEQRGAGLLDLAFAWLLSHPAVASVIAGATTPHQVSANAAAGAWALSPDERARVDQILENSG